MIRFWSLKESLCNCPGEIITLLVVDYKYNNTVWSYKFMVYCALGLVCCRILEPKKCYIIPKVEPFFGGSKRQLLLGIALQPMSPDNKALSKLALRKQNAFFIGAFVEIQLLIEGFHCCLGRQKWTKWPKQLQRSWTTGITRAGNE